ncbi:MAG: pyridoxamine 5'-phosphate oxidase family protein [Rhodanobacteraceae bacterium]
MPTPHELESRFWKELGSQRTMMLGLDGQDDGHVRPMTAQFEDSRSPIWFFTSKDNALVQQIGASDRAIASFTSKGHDLFASLHGRLAVENDRTTIDRLWNPFVAAWFEGGKEDPKLALLRLDAERAEIWLNASSLISGVKMLFGVDPKEDYKDHVADVSLQHARTDR